MTAADEGRDPLAEVPRTNMVESEWRPIAEAIGQILDAPSEGPRWIAWRSAAEQVNALLAARVAEAEQQATDRALAPVVAEVERAEDQWLTDEDGDAWVEVAVVRAAVTPEARDDHDRRVRAEALREAASAWLLSEDGDLAGGVRVDAGQVLAVNKWLRDRADATGAGQPSGGRT